MKYRVRVVILRNEELTFRANSRSVLGYLHGLHSFYVVKGLTRVLARVVVSCLAVELSGDRSRIFAFIFLGGVLRFDLDCPSAVRRVRHVQR